MFTTFKKSCKKLIFPLFVVIFTIGALSGCGSKKATTKTPSIKEISTKIEQAIDTSGMKIADANKLEKLYKINSDEVEEFVLYAPASNIKANEIVLIKVKDANKVNEIKEKVSKRVENQSTSFKDYLPNEYALIEKHVLKVNGNYILLAISKDTEKIEKIFDESFK
ncbi:hypothetical protein BD780_000193 [Clostridium tetanomorphum]|uniref:DUF4358 domain-containing protein n=1 Tax=Clostridium tetanomorphum TaxID=1553 RepID=A0A923E7R5_CLOTT|nr:DUF4358 domain-containing protein [Clostridium tetanomorphum]KAJ51073.1 hypothetical protein CTM_14343 [Clostridium tetanomorphum DSM 665]MBC2397993.1 DUF4358 domain-containing protein [Clostridium tetanomorphum]MBP1864501.1 hypothetical protein [Clostridium tetanomorphum]NRS82968.1 hypothetical protein [Clostridium tetanomorphum]NRZ98936.1 hypothetical protein [Clostridium tetanomorphum]